MTTLQTEWTARELLETDAVVEPLFAGGVRCHGGFDEDGSYVSPRTRNRFPAITAWQEQRERDFGTPLLDVPLSTWPENYPNVAQGKYLLQEGVRDPIVATLTRIGTVEGFGAMIRYSTIPDWQKVFEEDVRGTAIAHLDHGLFEAHARDEAGYGDEGGHKQMWFSARDVAFNSPITDDQSNVMLERMGLVRSYQGGTTAAYVPERLWPDIDEDLELLLVRMTSLLLIEISAFHVFAWAEEVLADTALVAGDGEAARLVSYIRSDETPHVEYLKTVLSEMRDRTFIGHSGKRYAGTEVIGRIWDRALSDSLGTRREQNIALTVREVEHALAASGRRGEILDHFHALAS